MESVNCFDISIEALDKVSKDVKYVAITNPKRLVKFQKYCGIIDNLAKANEGKSFEISVNSKTMEIKLSLVCSDLIVDDNESEFYALAQACKKIVLTSSTVDEDCIKIEFTLYGIWDMA